MSKDIVFRGEEMKRYLGISFACFCSVLLVAGVVYGRSVKQLHEFAEPQVDVDRVGDIEGTMPAPQKVLQDTIWIADWTFDEGGDCVDTGWTHVDNHILNDGVEYWDVTLDFDGDGGITGDAAALGYQNNPCCEEPNGYDNNWYQAIVILYNGAGDLSLDYIVDSESGFDFFQVEVDSACASFDLVDFSVDPSGSPASFRQILVSDSGFNLTGSVTNQALPDFGIESCLYIAFFSDGGWSPCDGLQSSSIGRATVVDNITLVDGSGTRTETFTGGTITIGTFENIADNVPFGTWARVFKGITDNDVCSDNTSCAWLWTDDGSFDGNPTLANDPSMAFAPGGFVIRNWLDDIIVSPWVSLAETPTATGTPLTYRRFPGNFFVNSRGVQNWSVRGKTTVDGEECISGWGHAFRWNSLSTFRWLTGSADMTADFDPTSEEIQVRHRTSDWQWIAGASPPAQFIPGPGPFTDRTRIGRLILSGPVIDEGIDSRNQGQDAFPSVQVMWSGPPTQESFLPSNDRFGTVAFSKGSELTINASGPNLVTGDSCTVGVTDARNAGGIVSVDFYGTIVAGPHAGKAPPPWTVGANGFFVIAADSVRNASNAVVNEQWFVDLDDFYLLGGDVLNYFWLTVDAAGGVSSMPAGVNAVPVGDLASVQEATQGIYEVSALPTIEWNSNLLDDIAADPNGKIDPNSNPDRYITGSTQKNCILYVNRIASRRRSGDVNRTSFMYTLDALGYRGAYDVFDHQGMGNTNNHLGSRANPIQAQGYNLLVYDAGNVGPAGNIVPDGVDIEAGKVPQQQWFDQWLTLATSSEAGFFTLWLIGSNILEEFPTASLYNSTMQVTLASTDQGLNANPDVLGVSSFTFDQGAGSVSKDFTGDEYSLAGGCPIIRNYDGLAAGSGVSVETHVYRDPVTQATGDGSVVMNSNGAADWNTVFMSHPWFDMRQTFVHPSPTPTLDTPQKVLMEKILSAALPLDCQEALDPTDTGQGDEIDVVRVNTLRQNIPNPFNPTTRIEFDLAQDGQVSLRIYDVAGRLVRTLIDAPLKRGRYVGESAAVWDGFDESGQRVSSGVYFYRLNAPDFVATKKMVMMK
ncbi:MAG: T9SS type A sorting domain-containing protein [Candidatus Latescibacterota bacterium]|nr:MAG: T9SS type A sorting domain-containing protein [Candidatus Latescibacterota bacterium]